MNNKIIFLDFDGVICMDWSKHIDFEGHFLNPLDVDAVKLLNELTDKTGAAIVVSSVWRIGDRWDILPIFMKNQGITGRVIDKTPRMFDEHNNSVQRGNEIAKWLEGKNDITDFVVLDDDSDMDAVKDNFVQTLTINKENGELEDGFKQHHLEKALAILDKSSLKAS